MCCWPWFSGKFFLLPVLHRAGERDDAGSGDDFHAGAGHLLVMHDGRVDRVGQSRIGAVGGSRPGIGINFRVRGGGSQLSRPALWWSQPAQRAPVTLTTLAGSVSS